MGEYSKVPGCAEMSLLNHTRLFFTYHSLFLNAIRCNFFVNSLSDIFAPLGLFPGGGLCIQKVPLGVTVRGIQFIDDVTISSATRPLYAVLISREIEADQGLLDNDGRSPEERQKIKDEKEAEKTRRQVEADLGGFEVEQEWVEEIEHDDCFKVDASLGRAPPLPKEII